MLTPPRCCSSSQQVHKYNKQEPERQTEKCMSLYAVVTGVQIHNWGEPFDGKEPNLEFVAPSSIYVVVNGQRFDVDLSRYPVGGHTSGTNALGSLWGASLLLFGRQR